MLASVTETAPAEYFHSSTTIPSGPHARLLFNLCREFSTSIAEMGQVSGDVGQRSVADSVARVAELRVRA